MSYRFTKAESLSYILKNLKRKKIKFLNIPDFIYFSKSEYKKNKKNLFIKIKKKFKNKLIIIRSSSKDEDNLNLSNAGKYISFQKIEVNEKKVFDCIDKLTSKFKSPNDQILIQQFVMEPEISGVIFTKEANYNSPYYIINYDKSGTTNLVTSGKNNPTMQTEIVYREKIDLSKKFHKYLEDIKHLEKLFNSNRLDLEFAIKNKKFYLFQCRYLPKFKNENKTEEINKVLINLKKKIDKLKNKNPSLSGKTTYFSNMSDWNPAEMIGNKPKPLAISLYSELITNKIWSLQRKEYGYKDVAPNILMVNLAGTPFIDLRTDLNSFIPEDLDNKLTEKLINNYLKRIKNRPFLHDKIEFDIINTCYDLADNKEKINFLNTKEKKIYLSKLHQLSNNIFLNVEKLLDKEFKKINLLEKKILNIKKTNLSEIQKIFFLVDDCKNYGTLPFAGVARIAFIFTQILKNFKDKKIVNENQIMQLYSTIPTITKQINNDYLKIKNKKDKQKFLKTYGHLRPSTYSISSLNYKEGFETYFSNKKQTKLKIGKKNNIFSSLQHLEITKLFKKNRISINSDNFLRYLKKSIQYREYFKFIFSKSIDEIFNNLIKLGKIVGIKRKDLEFISIEKILSSYSVLETEKLSKILKNEITKNKKSFNITKKINFPDFLETSNDIYFQKIRLSKGNFITNKKVRGEIKYLKNLGNFKSLKDKIIFLENADPGFDFVFSHPIRGLVTKYGGANSHMAIRCLELSIPAIIGIGHNDFEKMKNKNFIEYDCEQKLFKEIS